MMTAAELLAALNGMVIASSVGDGIRISTHCLYPSNSSVSVTVRGGRDEFTISDDGGALDEISSAGLPLVEAERFLKRLVKHQGLKVGFGAIYSPPVPLEGVAAAVLLVANAAKECAGWGLANLRPARTRNFREDLEIILNKHGCAGSPSWQ